MAKNQYKQGNTNIAIKLLASYVGSKKYYVNKESFSFLRNRNIVEFFCGSAILSTNYASSSILNDTDPYIYKILSNYDELIVPDVFTQDDYFEVRKRQDWWKYAYCLSKMSFSGVFRYSKNGWNVPVKKNIKEVRLKNEYEMAKSQFNFLDPIVTNVSFEQVEYWKLDNPILIFDPPYQDSQASYNINFDYEFYWYYVFNLLTHYECIIFDTAANLAQKDLLIYAIESRKMRVNGARKGNLEVAVKTIPNFKSDLDFANKYEKKIADYFGAEYSKDRTYDILLGDTTIEIKCDRYFNSLNFFIEHYSDYDKLSLGGPYRAQRDNIDEFWYAFVSGKKIKLYRWKTSTLIDRLESVDRSNGREIANRNWITYGYLVKIAQLEDCCYDVQEIVLAN